MVTKKDKQNLACEILNIYLKGLESDMSRLFLHNSTHFNDLNGDNIGHHLWHVRELTVLENFKSDLMDSARYNFDKETATDLNNSVKQLLRKHELLVIKALVYSNLIKLDF